MSNDDKFIPSKRSWTEWWDYHYDSIVEKGAIVVGGAIMIGGAYFVYSKYFRE